MMGVGRCNLRCIDAIPMHWRMCADLMCIYCVLPPLAPLAIGSGQVIEARLSWHCAGFDHCGWGQTIGALIHGNDWELLSRDWWVTASMITIDYAWSFISTRSTRYSIQKAVLYHPPSVRNTTSSFTGYRFCQGNAYYYFILCILRYLINVS